jgi:hypothetical protein
VTVRGIPIGLALAALVVGGCGGETVGMADMGGGDLKTCRRLGGEAVFVEYEKDGSKTTTVVQGVPEGEAGLHSDLSLETRKTKKALRANGWTDKAINDLISMPDDNEMARNFGYEGTDAQLDAKRRSLHELLDRMPSCLDEARGAPSPDG